MLNEKDCLKKTKIFPRLNLIRGIGQVFVLIES